MGNNYFKDMILPSVGLPYKASYSLPEAAKILDCSKVTLWRMSRREEITITPNKKVYRREFELMFNGEREVPPRMKP